MAYLLLIDTSGPTSQVSVAEDGELIHSLENPREKDHAAVLILQIDQLLKISGLTPSRLEAIGLSAGPGSYTGLRVGSSTAKGLCYSWGIPLVPVSSLKLMAHGMIAAMPESELLYCPMIDARRNEVFTALYDDQLQEIIPPGAMILQPDSFADVLTESRILFSGDGIKKWKEISNSSLSRVVFQDIPPSPDHLAKLSYRAFREGKFGDLAYFEPFYLKAFHQAPLK